MGLGISLNLESTKTSGLKHVDIYSSAQTGFDVIPRSGLNNPVYRYRADLKHGANQENLSISFPASDTNSGLYYAAVAVDSFGSGEPYYYPSSIKPFTVDPLLSNIEVSGFNGKVLASRDTFNKVVNTQIIGKISKDLSDNKQYQVKVI